MVYCLTQPIPWYVPKSFVAAQLYLAHTLNRPIFSRPKNRRRPNDPSNGNPIAHFRVHLSLSIKARPWCKSIHMKMSLICKWMKSHFQMKGWAPGLDLRKRFKETRKWPIWTNKFTVTRRKKVINYASSSRLFHPEDEIMWKAFGPLIFKPIFKHFSLPC